MHRQGGEHPSHMTDQTYFVQFVYAIILRYTLATFKDSQSLRGRHVDQGRERERVSEGKVSRYTTNTMYRSININIYNHLV